MVKGKSLSGHKKRENRVKSSTANILGQNGVDVFIGSETAMDNSCAMAYNNKANNNLNVSKPVATDNLKTGLPSKSKATSSRLNSNSKSEFICIPNNSIGIHTMNPNMNIPESQYYFLTKFMHQQKKTGQPDSIRVKQNETSNSTNLTSTTTATTTPSTITSTRHNMNIGTMSDTTNSDYKNNNLPKVEEPMCQCHLVLDPYPSQLSLR